MVTLYYIWPRTIWFFICLPIHQVCYSGVAWVITCVQSIVLSSEYLVTIIFFYFTICAVHRILRLVWVWCSVEHQLQFYVLSWKIIFWQKSVIQSQKHIVCGNEHLDLNNRPVCYTYLKHVLYQETDVNKKIFLPIPGLLAGLLCEWFSLNQNWWSSSNFFKFIIVFFIILFVCFS